MVKLSLEEVKKLFPMPSYRPQQEDTIAKIVEMLNSGFKVIQYQGAVGSGKSAVNTTFCRAFRSFYSTPQLSLIAQIENDPYISKYYESVKGRANYNCMMGSGTVADCREKYEKFTCINKDSICGYYMDKIKCVKANSVLTSLDYIMVEGINEQSKYYLGNRQLLVVDECHNAPDKILSHFSFNTNKGILKNLNVNIFSYKDEKNITQEEAKNVIQALMPLVQDRIDKLNKLREKKRQGLIKEESRELERLLNWLDKAERFLELSKNQWVYEGLNNLSLEIKPVYAREFSRMLWKRGDIIILSSATIPSNFINESGLDLLYRPDQIGEKIDLPMIFPVGNRPIILKMVDDLNRNTEDKVLPKMIPVIQEIANKHPGKIAVHCGSYDRAGEIYRLSSAYPVWKRMLLQDKKNRIGSLNQWQSSEDKIFLCVDFTEGQDWKGDKCVAQILVKVPYASLGDKRIYYRVKIHKDQEWYIEQAIVDIAQAYGRTIRCEADKKPFYILDGEMFSFIVDNLNSFPRYIRDALILAYNGHLEKISPPLPPYNPAEYEGKMFNIITGEWVPIKK